MRPPGRQRTSVRGRLASGTTAVVSPSARSAAGRRGDARGCRSTALANPCGGDRRLLAFGRAVDGPNSRSHNALATALGAISAASQLLMLVAEILRMKTALLKIYAKHTGQPESVLAEAMERDRFMSPTEAVQFGLIDSVLEKPPEKAEGEPKSS
ncbi:hypothetical protein BOX15_Mlig016012g1 [Macrostomum lignano]|uniref:ATP-dependent Clp protease proteolytic subunit n=1 Tax=Macrostomum lignano TaxID=282301 RepID=A0A267GBP1_9PLAT|nr:hypothetical protein BOX15_Mlig016012g1 [Macrostomum lignano]